MKKFAIIAGAMLISGVAYADNTGSNGAGKNCFGQARSEGAKTFQPMGQIISQRAQTESTDGSANQNVQLNREFKENCQANPS